MRWFGLTTLLFLTATVFVLCSFVFVQSAPVSSPEAALKTMQQVPQWHCLRYRKFDLVRRCRNYRIGRRH